MSEPLYSTKTPFLKSISDSVSREDRTWAIRWSLKEIEKPIRRLRKKYPWYTTPTDCKRLGELFMQCRVPKDQVMHAVEDLGEGAGIIGTHDKVGRALAQSVAEGVKVIVTKQHVIRFICYYLTALKMDGASDREIEKEAERMTLSYERKQNG